jgi:hypothetical protein
VELICLVVTYPPCGALRGYSVQDGSLVSDEMEQIESQGEF